MGRERWRAVPGFEGYYEVSDRGRVRSLPRTVSCGKTGIRRKVAGKLKKPYSYDGYLRLSLWKGSKSHAFFVHRLVLLAFEGPPPEEGMEAAHFPDPDRANNRLENLRWELRDHNQAEMRYRNGAPLFYAVAVAEGREPWREPGDDDGPVVDGQDPFLTGETPF